MEKNTEFLPTDISDTNKRKERKEKRTRERERESASVVIWKITILLQAAPSRKFGRIQLR